MGVVVIIAVWVVYFRIMDILFDYTNKGVGAGLFVVVAPIVLHYAFIFAQTL